MALEAFIPFRTSAGDASLSILKLFEDKQRKGFVNAWYDTDLAPGRRAEAQGPLLEAVAGALQVRVVSGSGIGWMALGADGLVARAGSADGPWTLTLSAGVKWYVCLRLKYVSTPGGTIMEFTALTASDYTASAFKDELVIVGVAECGALDTEFAASDFSYAERHRVEGLYDNNWRPSVQAFGDLPTLVDDPVLKQGDAIFVRDTLTIYGWDHATTTWIPAGGASVLHSGLGRNQMALTEYMRSLHGTGILAGDTSADSERGKGLLLNVHEHASTGTRHGIGELNALVNGHYVRTRTLDIDLAAKPGAGNRWDMVYVEVYRQVIAAPSSLTYPDAAGTTRTAAQVSAALEALTAAASHDVNSFDVPFIETTYDNQQVAVIVSLRSVENLSLADIEDPYTLPLSVGAINNSDGNAWSWGSGQSDKRVWISDHTSSYDGKAWGVPLTIINRTSAEDPGAADGVRIYRSGVRHIFPVYPEATNGPWTRNDEVAEQAAKTAMGALDLYSGMIADKDYGFTGLNGTFGQPAPIAVAGYKAVIPEAGTRASLPAAPATGTRHDFVVFECRFVHHPDEAQDGRTIIPLGEMRPLSFAAGYGKQVYLQVDAVVWDVAGHQDVPEAMASQGYTRVGGERVMYRKADASYDPRSNTEGYTYALPIAIVHRLNSAAFNVGTNPNGGQVGTRWDGYDMNTLVVAGQVSPWIMQAWSLTGLSNEDIVARRQETLDQLLRGTLATMLAPHPSHADVSGVRHLIADAFAGAPVAGYTLNPAAPDGFRHIWSEAEEIRPFGRSFDPSGAFSDAVYTYTTGSPNHLRIQMPAGMAIYRPPSVAGNTGLYFLIYDSVGPPQDPLRWDDLDTTASAAATISNVTVNSTDTFGYVTDIEFDITATGSEEIRLYFWAIHKRSDSDVQHQDNRGLSAIINRPIRGTWGAAGVGNELGMRPMVANVRVPNFSGTNLVVTQAMLEAAIEETGNATFRGIMGVSAVGMLTGGFTWTTQINDAQDEATITFGAGLTNRDVNVLVAYQTSNVDRWVEFSRGGRSVSGYYIYEEHEWTGMATTDRYFRVSTGINQHLLRHVCLMWRDTGTSDPWDIIPEDQYGIIISEGTDGFQIDNLAAGFQSAGKDYRAVLVKVRPPASSGEDFLLWYEATPYQGLSHKAGVGNRTTFLGPKLQGVMMEPGQIVLTTMGYHPQYAHFGGISESNIPKHAIDYDLTFGFAARARALAASGSSMWRRRLKNLSAADLQYTHYSVLATVPAGYDCVVDRVPWPDFNLDLFIPVSFADNWIAGQFDEWYLKGQDISLAGSNAGAGFLLLSDCSLASPGVGVQGPRRGLTVDYGANYGAYAGLMEGMSMRDGKRGVSVTHHEWDVTVPRRERFVSDTVSFLAFGNLEGLLTSEMDQGGPGWVIEGELPTYAFPGFPWRLDNPSATYATWDGRYYGGHAVAIDTDEGPIMQFAGGPKQLSGVAPQSPFQTRLGGTFDAFHIIGRPLPIKRI